jgi:hypothetical protein
MLKPFVGGMLTSILVASPRIYEAVKYLFEAFVTFLIGVPVEPVPYLYLHLQRAPRSE